MGTRRSDMILGAALLGVAGFFGMGALRMRYFTAIGPGPGFFPRWLALLLGLLGLAILLRAWLGRIADGAGENWPARDAAGRVVVPLAALAWIALTIETLGFPVSALVATLAILVALGAREARVILPVALGASFGAYLLFARWLGVPLPSGGLGP
jgi:putative tricarboxylic transport membrane protein